MTKPKRNLWPLLPVFILGSTVLANIVLVRLAMNTDDELLPVEDDAMSAAAGTTHAAPAEESH